MGEENTPAPLVGSDNRGGDINRLDAVEYSHNHTQDQDFQRPNLPQRATPIARARGIRCDLERIASETADFGTAEDIGMVISLVDRLIRVLAEGADE